MSALPVSAPATRPFEYLPVGLFGSVMGLSGLSVAWRLAHVRFAVDERISQGIGVVAIAAFLLVGAAYLTKLVCATDAVRAEFTHPIASSLFGTILISLLLLPIIVAPVSLDVARLLWAIGAVGMIGFAWLMVDRWMTNRQSIAHATPAWIVPVVGMLDVPLAVPSLGIPHMHGVMVLGLAVGLFFALPLFTLIFSRLVFEPPMPAPLQPTLMILVAPFAVGTSTYITTTGATDLFAQSLYALTLFFLAVLIGRLRFLLRACPFRVGWWAVSFPLAACAIAALRIAEAFPSSATDGIAIALLALATGTIAWLLVRTLIGVARSELKQLSS